MLMKEEKQRAARVEIRRAAQEAASTSTSEQTNENVQRKKEEENLECSSEVQYTVTGIWGSAMAHEETLRQYVKDNNLINIDNVIEKEFVSLVDAGLAINCAYPLMLHPKRKVDVIISLDYSDGDIYETLTLAKKFAEENNLRFPSVDTKHEQPEDCSVYSGPSTPTVIHMPLFNEFNKHGK
ncbi:PA24C phospholipase, partial [Polypterus senegalus]